MYLAKSFRKRVTKSKPWTYFFLKDCVWDPKAKKRRSVYRAYIGTQPQLSIEKARRIARKLGITVAELKKIKGLRVLEREQS